MNLDPDHIFWARRWAEARHISRGLPLRTLHVPDLAMVNYALYLSEVYSWMFEHWRIYTRRDHVN